MDSCPSRTKEGKGGAGHVSATPPMTAVAFETNSLRNVSSALWYIADHHDAALALNHRRTDTRLTSRRLLDAVEAGLTLRYPWKGSSTSCSW